MSNKEENQFKYLKNPEIVKAFQYDGDLKNREGDYYVPQWAIDAEGNGRLCYETYKEVELFLETSQGPMLIEVSDYAFMDSMGQFCVLPRDVFEAKYSKVDS